MPRQNVYAIRVSHKRIHDMCRIALEVCQILVVVVVVVVVSEAQATD
jgi:hypothetical protein